MDMQHEDIVKVGGIQKLLDALEKDIFTHPEAEGDHPYKLGGERHGKLSRQIGEPMTSYISRR